MEESLTRSPPMYFNRSGEISVLVRYWPIRPQARRASQAQRIRNEMLDLEHGEYFDEQEYARYRVKVPSGMTPAQVKTEIAKRLEAQGYRWLRHVRLFDDIKHGAFCFVD